jgi:hypothetical protein
MQLLRLAQTTRLCGTRGRKKRQIDHRMGTPIRWPDSPSLATNSSVSHGSAQSARERSVSEDLILRAAFGFFGRPKQIEPRDTRKSLSRRLLPLAVFSQLKSDPC